MEEDKLVEAIEAGRIVKVPEFYAKREGLAIIRRPEINQSRIAQYTIPQKQIKIEKTPYDFKRATSNWKDKQVTSELVENWNWQIRIERRKIGLTRKQLGKLLNVDEEKVKMIEYGSLPSGDFILINRIQDILKLNLRKDKKDYSKSLPEMIKKEKESTVSPSKDLSPKKEKDSLFGNDIEIIE